MIKALSSVNRRQILKISGGAAALTMLPGLAAAEYPPTDGEMQGFILLKDRALAPTIPFFDADDNVRHFSDFGNKVLLVNFWATWCAPCVHELPNLDNVMAMLGGPDFAVLTISQDRGGAAVAKPFLEERMGLRNLETFVDKRLKLGRALGVRGLPTTYLIDRRGMLVGGMTGSAAWDSPDALKLIRHVMAEGAGSSDGYSTDGTIKT